MKSGTIASRPTPGSIWDGRTDCASCEPLSEPAQEILTLAHEAFVSRFHAVDETNYLRHNQRKQRQRQHRDKEMSQIDAAGNRSLALQDAEPGDRLLKQ